MDKTLRKQSVARCFLRSYRGRIIIALGLIVVVQVTFIWLTFVLPYQREKRIAAKIEAREFGSVGWTDNTPVWIPRFIQVRFPVWDRITSARFHGEVTDAELDRLQLLTSLRAVDLSSTQVNDAGVEHLKGLTSLVELDFVNTQITDAGLEHLQGLKSLSYIHLDKTRITDAGLEYLKELHNLVALELSQTQVTDVGLEHLEGLLRLEYLSLNRTQVTDAGLNHLKGLSSLKSLSLTDTQTTPQGRETMRKAFLNCEIKPNP